MDKNEFNSIEKLYHYTKFDTAIEILLSKSLRFGVLSEMNDINESDRSVFCEQGLEFLSKDVIEALKTYQQLSLTSDLGKNAGYNIPAMWAHYAERGNGVCLVFDKQKILSCLDDQFWYGNVVYDAEHSNHIILNENDVHAFLKKNKQDLFFTKTKDWEYEQEFRIIKGGNSEDKFHLQYNDSLLAVIMRPTKDTNDFFNSQRVKSINEITDEVVVLEYASFLGTISLKDCFGSDWLSNGFDNIDLDL